MIKNDNISMRYENLLIIIIVGDFDGYVERPRIE